jgi:hypothetical protein
MFLLQTLAWFIFSCVLMSFVEHQVHAKLMHRRNALSTRLKQFKRMLESHAVLHHGTYRTKFHDEPVPVGEDKGIRLNIVEGVLEMLPVTLIIGIFSIQGAVIFSCVVALHHYLWGLIHLEMHKPEARYFSNWKVYRFLAMHHYLHHRYPDKNFNVVIPFADYILGTNAKPTKEDLDSFPDFNGPDHAPAESVSNAAKRQSGKSLSKV